MPKEIKEAYGIIQAAKKSNSQIARQVKSQDMTQSDFNSKIGIFIATTKSVFALLSNPALQDIFECVRINPSLVIPKKREAGGKCLVAAKAWAVRKKEEYVPAFQEYGAGLLTDGMRTHGRYIAFNHCFHIPFI
jgi:hypothetical protein